MSTSPNPEEARDIALLALLFEAGLALAAVTLGWVLDQPPLEGTSLTWEAAPEMAFAAGWGLAAAAPMIAGLWAMDRFPVGPLRQLRQLVDQSIVPLFTHVTLGQMACISLMAGLGEEMLFRGVLQRAVGDWIGPPWGVWGGLLAASLAFGVCHWLSHTYLVLAALIGLYLGWLYLATGEQLIAPITAHAVYDFVALAYLVRYPRRRTRERRGQESEKRRPDG